METIINILESRSTAHSEILNAIYTFRDNITDERLKGRLNKNVISELEESHAHLCKAWTWLEYIWKLELEKEVEGD